MRDEWPAVSVAIVLAILLLVVAPWLMGAFGHG